MKRKLGCAVAVLALGACAPTEMADQRRLLLESWGEHALLAEYSQFELGTLELDARARAFCQALDETGLLTAREAWWQARAPWKRAEVFAFGPYLESPYRLGAKIDFWPVRVASIETVLTGVEPLTEDSVLLFGAAQKGLPAIEYLLYAGAADSTPAFMAEPRRCEYLLLLTAELHKDAAAIHAAWAPAGDNYLAELINAGRGSRLFDSLGRAVGEIVNRMAFTIESIRATKLGKPLGTETGGVPDPELVESRFSERSLTDIRDNLRGVEWLFFGEQAKVGLDAYLRHHGKYFAKALREALDSAYLALDQAESPLTRAVVERPDTVEALSARLGELQRLIQVDIINALSLTVTFSDNDGD